MKRAYVLIPALLLAFGCDSKGHKVSADAAVTASEADAPKTALVPPADLLSQADAIPANTPIHYRFEADVLGKGCAKVLGCSATGHTTNEGITHCAEVVNWMGSADWGRDTFMLALYDDNDWPLLSSLMQNMDCVQAATDCQGVLACVNQGQAASACTRRTGYSLGRYCSDATHLRSCSLGVEASIDCGRLGLSCIEVSTPDGSQTLAACANRASVPGGLDTVEVTCQGTMAQFSFGADRFGFDCGFLGATCVQGSYSLSSDLSFCVGARSATCQGHASDRCEGDSAVVCMNGRESAMSCADIGTTCTTDYPNDNPHCGFACASTSDTCTDGVIHYCGLGGMATLDCKSLGFSGCQLALPCEPQDPARAWCAP